MDNSEFIMNYFNNKQPNLKIEIENKIKNMENNFNDEKNKEKIKEIENKIQIFFDENNIKEKNTFKNFIINSNELINKKNDLNISLKTLNNLKQNIKNNKKLSNEIINKLNNDKNLNKNFNENFLLKKINIYNNNNNFIKENEYILSENEKKLILFRNLIKFSYEEAKNYSTLLINSYELFKELNYVEKEIKYDLDEYFISPSFKIFLIEIEKETNKLKIFSLLLNMYNIYSENEDDKILLILHNNIEIFLDFINYNIFFKEQKNLLNIFIYFKNFSQKILNKILSNEINKLTELMTKHENFENLSYEINFEKSNKMIKNTLNFFEQFFINFYKISNKKEFIFNLNYLLNLYFDLINRKILIVKEFKINDIKRILNLSQEIPVQLKKIFNDYCSLEINLKINNLLEKNFKYKKFEEILFVLNANLKDIKNYVINNNFVLLIDKIELTELIISIFEKSDNRDNLINFIIENCK